jgi:hypothetical protein
LNAPARGEGVKVGKHGKLGLGIGDWTVKEPGPWKGRAFVGGDAVEKRAFVCGVSWRGRVFVELGKALL